MEALKVIVGGDEVVDEVLEELEATEEGQQGEAERKNRQEVVVATTAS